MKHLIYSILTVLSVILVMGCADKRESYKMNYNGTPYLDKERALAIQTLPGKIECEFYDNGGYGIAYFDTDSANNGSGGLNKGTDYLNSFRTSEAPDISYTKFHDSIDNSPYNMVEPQKDQMYIGWTEPKEWTRYSVDVTESGIYKVSTMYTSNRGGSIRLYIDDTDSTGLLAIPTTNNSADTLAWRQWHHWNYVDSLTSIQIYKGRRIITLKIEEEGNFNFDYLLFEKLK